MSEFKKTLDLISSYKYNNITFNGKSVNKQTLYNKILKLESQNYNVNPDELYNAVKSYIDSVNMFNKQWDKFWRNHDEINSNGSGNLNRK